MMHKIERVEKTWDSAHEKAQAIATMQLVMCYLYTAVYILTSSYYTGMRVVNYEYICWVTCNSLLGTQHPQLYLNTDSIFQA